MTKDKVIIMDPAYGKVTLNMLDFTLKFTGFIMLFSPKKQLAIYKNTKLLNKVILKTLFKNKDIILSIIILSLIFTAFTCLSTFYLKITLDKVITTAYKNLIIITIIFMFLYIIKVISSFFRNILLIYLNAKLDLSLIVNTFKKVLLLPFNYYKNRSTGEVISRINDLVYVKHMIANVIVTVCLDFLISIVGGIILFTINKDMFLILIVITLIYIIILLIFKPSFKTMININQENNAKINSLFVEAISSFETIKALNIEGIMQKKMEKIYSKSLLNMIEYEKIVNLENFLKDLVSSLGILIVYFIGCKNIMEGGISIGSLITFNFLINYYLEPINNIICLNKDYHYALNSLKRANNLMEIEVEDLTKKSNLEVTGNIDIKNLSFSYNPSKVILKSISLNIKENEKVLVLGNSGSGKSTLLKLLYGYYKPLRESIYINNYDILDYEICDIRSNISYVCQNEMLYTDTIINNIKLHRNIKTSEYLDVCKLTGINEMLASSFLGYDTMLEENGINLSGGQRQRIILTRALLKNSKILLIDEGLNELDIKSERNILKNIFKYYENRTIIIVSHRLDNMDLYDKVIKIEDGVLKAVIAKDKRQLYE